MKYILIETDGYQINENRFSTKTEASEYLQSRYNSLIPESWEEEEETAEKEMSYCNDAAATLYTGEDVYVWKLIEV